MNSEKYIGLDFHQATIVVAVMDSTGKLWNPSSRPRQHPSLSFSGITLKLVGDL